MSAEQPPGTEEIEPRRGPPTETVILGIMGVAYFVAGVVYLALQPDSANGELAGVVLFFAGAIFVLIAAGYFLVSLRRVQSDVEVGERVREQLGPVAGTAPNAGDLYLPLTSVWPLCIGIGATLTLLGVPLGWWFLLPGIALLTYGFVGFAHQSRTRG